MTRTLLACLLTAAVTSAAWWFHSWALVEFDLPPHSNVILELNRAPDFSWHTARLADGHAMMTQHFEDHDHVTVWRWR